MDLLNLLNQSDYFCNLKQQKAIELSEEDANKIREEEKNKLKFVPFKLNKQILKNRKNPKKGYIKKQFEMIPLLLKEISSHNKYLLFGFQEIETYYQDYSNPYDNELIDNSECLIGISSIEKRNNKDELQINLFSKGSSGITDFQFLIDHFAKFTTSEYHQLYQGLVKYQQIAKSQKDHYNDVRMKLNSRIISTEDVERAQEDFKLFAEKYIEKNTDTSIFYVYELYSINVELMDVSPVKKCISLALMSLLGVEPTDYEQFAFHQGDAFQSTKGKERMVDLMDMIDIFANGNTYKRFDSHIQTIDNIKIATVLEQEIMYWDERPEWASYLDFVIIIGKFDLSAQKIKSVIEQREKKNRVEADLEILESMQFDYVVQSEIFLEKYYPEAYKNLTEKKSIKSSLKVGENDTTEILIE